LVALGNAVDGPQVVVWRWFDAVVLNVMGRSVSLWEPGHGTVLAEPRDHRRNYRPGSRAYLSAGLPGAEWWVAGLTVDRAEDADVDLDEVERTSGFSLGSVCEHGLEPQVGADRAHGSAAPARCAAGSGSVR
jgi:hypothetical protein